MKMKLKHFLKMWWVKNIWNSIKNNIYKNVIKIFILNFMNEVRWNWIKYLLKECD